MTREFLEDSPLAEFDQAQAKARDAIRKHDIWFVYAIDKNTLKAQYHVSAPEVPVGMEGGKAAALRVLLELVRDTASELLDDLSERGL